MGSISGSLELLPELITVGSSTLWGILVEMPFTISTGIELY